MMWPIVVMQAYLMWLVMSPLVRRALRHASTLASRGTPAATAAAESQAKAQALAEGPLRLLLPDALIWLSSSFTSAIALDAGIAYMAGPDIDGLGEVFLMVSLLILPSCASQLVALLEQVHARGAQSHTVVCQAGVSAWIVLLAVLMGARSLSGFVVGANGKDLLTASRVFPACVPAAQLIAFAAYTHVPPPHRSSPSAGRRGVFAWWILSRVAVLALPVLLTVGGVLLATAGGMLGAMFAVLWTSFASVILNFVICFSRNFRSGRYVSFVLLVLQIMYTPMCARGLPLLAKLRHLVMVLMGNERAASASYAAGFLLTYPGLVPFLQWYTLRKIRDDAIDAIIAWPGRATDARSSETAKRYGVLYLRHEIRVDEATRRLYGGPRAMARALRRQGLQGWWMSLPLFWELISTTRKLLVVVACHELAHEPITLGLALSCIMIAWQFLLLMRRPYATAPVRQLEASAGEASINSAREGRVKAAVLPLVQASIMFDCNQVETVGTYAVIMLLWMAAVFRTQGCGEDLAEKPTCNVLDWLCVVLIVLSMLCRTRMGTWRSPAF